MKPEKSQELGAINSLLQQTPIAITGLGALFPKSENLQQYWENILAEVDCITDVPASRWNIDDYYDPDPRAADKTYCKRGGFIPDVDFNPMDFGIPPTILEATDISQLLALVVARSALEDAGYDDLSGDILQRTGVILGVAIGRQLGIPLSSRLQYPVWKRVLQNCGIAEEDTEEIIQRIKDAHVGWQENSFPGALGNVVAGRIANRFNLGGTNCVVDAACASSLSAVKMAVGELLEGRSDMMLTGGVDTDNSIMMYMCFSKTPAFTQHDHVRPFDAESDGMMVGEGLGMLVLKRLEDAERDQDRIYAVIRGIGTSSDGRYKSIYAPRSEGQTLALRRAYADANIEPSTVGLVEAHGTGTAAGDPVEVSALNEVMGENNPRARHIALGSVKSQIGHTKAAAGAASMIKTSLALYHQILPATINVETPMDPLATQSTPLYINTQTRPWIRSADDPPRRAGVSAFGFGGTNFHIVLEEYQGNTNMAYRLQRVAEPILLSAETPQKLQAKCAEVLEQLSADEDGRFYHELLDASATATVPQTWARLGFVATARDEACDRLRMANDMLTKNLDKEAWSHPQGLFYRRQGIEPTRKVVALFPGQGSQYLGMGREVACAMPPIRDAMGAMDTLFKQDGLEPISNVIYPPPVFEEADRQAQKEKLRQTQYAQPAIGAFSFGLYKILEAAGFQADFALGHSFGELTALWAAGAMHDEDYLALVKARGLSMAAAPTPGFDAGAMLAVTGDVSRIQELCKDRPGVSIANYNSNKQIVLAGSTDAIHDTELFLANEGFKTVPLPVSAAFHTALVEHARQPFAEAVQAADIRTPSIPVYANATADVYPSAPEQIRVQLADHITQSVLFKQQIENVYAEGGYCFVEIGPKSTLLNLVKDILGEKPHVAIALNGSSKKDSDRQLREALLQLRVIGLPLTQADPYQAPRKPAQAKPNPALTVRLTASNHLGKQTQEAMDRALNTEYQLRVPPRGLTPPPSVNGHTHTHQSDDAVATKAVPAEKYANGTNGHHTTLVNSAVTNGNGTNSANGHVVPVAVPTDSPSPSSSEKVQASAKVQDRETPTMPASKPEYRRVLDGIEQSVSQFMEYQSDSTRVHEQFLSHQGEYSKIFSDILRQQHDMVSQGSSSLEQLAAIRETLETLSRTVAQFHSHQGDTTRVHEQYIAHQGESARSLLQILQRHYGAHVNGSAAAPPPAPEPGTPAVNGRPKTAPEHHRPAESPSAPTPVTAPAPTPPAPSKAAAETATAAPVAAPAAPVAPSAPAAPTVDVEAIAETMLAIVSEKTGYPAEVLEPEMDMEADLGIDSIKRVEILGAMQEEFPNLPQPDPETIGELRTLGQIIDFIRNNLAAETATAAPVAAPAAPVAPSAPAAPAVDVEAIAETMLAIVSEKTGYPAEVLEPEMDMEADLGIDSIKRVEILGAMQEEFPGLPQPDPETIGELRTLGQIIDFIRNSLTTTPEPDPPSPLDAPIPSTNGTGNSAPDSAAVIHDTADAEQVPSSPHTEMVTAALYTAISEQTGYPADVLYPEMDIEADLAVDRVKRIEILSNVRDTVSELSTLKPETLGELRTLKELTRALAEQMNGAGAVAADEESTPATPIEGNAAAAENGSVETHGIYRHVVALQTLPPPDQLNAALAPGHVCVITDDGSDLTSALTERLADQGWPVVVLSFPTAMVERQAALPPTVQHIQLEEMGEEHLRETLHSIAEHHGPIGAFIHLNPALPAQENGLIFSETEKAIAKEIFLAAKHLQKPLLDAATHGRSYFMTVARLDGQFGLAHTVDFGAIGAGLFGLTKSLNLEWPPVFCRAVDMNRNMDTADAADAILAELRDPDAALIEVGHSEAGRVTLTTLRTDENGIEAEESETPDIDESSVFLVSGGAKGVTAKCIVQFAKRYRCRFILLGRSSIADTEPEWAQGCTDEAELKKRIVADLQARGVKPTPAEIQSAYKRLSGKREIEETLQRIADAGGQALYLSVDITDAAALATQLAHATETLGEITGIIHGAGNLADKWIEKKTEEDFELVYSTKVQGLANLLQAVPLEQLRHLVLFSSTAGFYGNVGQTDYALSNEVLNKTAHLVKLHHPACHVVSINWGPWDGGMVTPALKRIFALHGIDVIPQERGAQLFVNELDAAHAGTAQVVVSGSGKLGNFPMEAGEPRSELRTVQVRRTVTDAANPFLRDHTIGGQSVLPFTCAASWIIETSERVNPGYKFAEWNNMRVLKGITPAEIQDGELMLELVETTYSHGERIVLEATIQSQNAKGKPIYHYKGGLTLLWNAPTPPTMDGFAPTNNAERPGDPLYMDGTLFHGPAFQGIRQVLSATSDAITMACIAPQVENGQQGQFVVHRFNPFAVDVQLQSALVWSGQFKESGCLPSSIAGFELYEPIPTGAEFFVTMEVQQQSDTKVVVDITAHDREGTVYNRICSAEYTLSPRLKELFQQASEVHQAA